MKLAELRKVAVRKNVRIRFAVAGGLECVISEHGIAQIPDLARVPDFNLEEALGGATAFTLEPVSTDKRRPAPTERLTAQQLAVLVASGGPDAPHPEEHDE